MANGGGGTAGEWCKHLDGVRLEEGSVGMEGWDIVDKPNWFKSYSKVRPKTASKSGENKRVTWADQVKVSEESLMTVEKNEKIQDPSDTGNEVVNLQPKSLENEDSSSEDENSLDDGVSAIDVQFTLERWYRPYTGFNMRQLASRIPEDHYGLKKRLAKCRKIRRHQLNKGDSPVYQPSTTDTCILSPTPISSTQDDTPCQSVPIASATISTSPLYQDHTCQLSANDRMATHDQQPQKSILIDEM